MPKIDFLLKMYFFIILANPKNYNYAFTRSQRLLRVTRIARREMYSLAITAKGVRKRTYEGQ